MGTVNNSTPPPLFALRVRRPWAQRIVAGSKVVEYRAYRPHYLGPILVHDATVNRYIGAAILESFLPYHSAFAWKLSKPIRFTNETAAPRWPPIQLRRVNDDTIKEILRLNKNLSWFDELYRKDA